MLISCAVLALAAVPAMADNKVDAKALKGKWERTVGELKIVFDFKDDKTMRCLMIPNGSNEGLEVDCDFKVGDDAIVSVTVVKVDKKGQDAGPDKDDTYTFKAVIDKEKLTLSDLKGAKANDDAKMFVEGEYKKVK
jgi:hypothetical protein